MGILQGLKVPQKKKVESTFDPESSGYDDAVAAELIRQNPLTTPKPKKYKGEVVANEGAFQAWVWHPELQDYVKHSGSRDYRTGQMLKGRKHKTWNLAVEGEEKAGYEIYQGKDGKYYSKKKK